MITSNSLMTRADLVLVLIASLGVAGLYALWGGNQGAADTVRIGVAGEPEQTLPLWQNRRLTVHGPLGDSTVEVRDGQARFVASPCDGKQCVHSGWLHAAGDFAACLPNRVTLTLAGRDAYDAINF